MASSPRTVWMLCLSPLTSSSSEEGGEVGGGMACAAGGHDGDKAFEITAGHNIERADEKPLHQQTCQIHPQQSR